MLNRVWTESTLIPLLCFALLSFEACDKISAGESAAELLLQPGDGVRALSVPLSSGSLNSEKNDKVEK